MRCRTLNKKILNFLLNVKHTVVDDVKIFDDDSVVFYVHPTKVEQCAVVSVAAKPLTMMPAEVSAYAIVSPAATQSAFHLCLFYYVVIKVTKAVPCQALPARQLLICRL